MTLQEEKAEEAAIRGVLDAFAEALRAGDVDAMLSHCAPDVVAFDMLGPLQHAGATALRAVWEETLAPFVPPLEHELAQLDVAVSGDVAYCRGLSRFGGTRRDGGRSAHWLRLTLGLQKRGGRWKVAHQHVSVPFSMDDGKALLDLEP
jgi:uncharacterized protein (TIGR02246 family)